MENVYGTIAIRIIHMELIYISGGLKLRVISGTARGRSLKAVPGMGTRPTTDKVKEAIFSMIGPYFEGGQALDLFGGTGGLGIEALSRGIERAIFIDIEKKSVDIIQANLQSTGFSKQSEVYRNDAMRGLKALAKRDITFDLVFVDPPYKMKQVEELLLLMEEKSLLKQGATIVVEHDEAVRYPEQIGSCEERRYVTYGDIAVTIYQYHAGASTQVEPAQEVNDSE